MFPESIPIIGMSKWDDPEVSKAICEAAGKWGFFQIINHRVLENVKEATHQLFRLSSEEKGENLNVTEMDETKESLLLGSKRINLNYYPICPDPELTVGVGRYSDVSTLTVLLQRDIGGLYVRRDNDSWIHVPLANGSIVINVGDALQIMSNGRYMSIEHCVIANGSDNRISVPIFINPRPSDKIFLFLKHCPAERRPCIMKFCTGIMPSISSEKHLMGRKTTDVAKIWCHLF
ncbi:hypothetical protein OIU78_007221 [Salix suchowensis]|nr:hypothetical protein OIU78_007221 [Salix suchowensis]